MRSEKALIFAVVAYLLLHAGEEKKQDSAVQPQTQMDAGCLEKKP